jgi:dienelactone hydrolase
VTQPLIPGIDMRYRIQRHGQLVYEMPHYTTLGDWEARAHYLREHLLAVLGLYPLPERDAPCLQVTRRQECDGYTVENVYFESLPGFYCTGNLFRPLDPQAPCPAVLNLHGHWERGRLEHSALVSVQARCIAFARMGMVALACDMVGYNDSLQVMHHHFASRRGALWGISLMALQTWNAIRAIDLLQSMDEVDSSHIGCTGASGGGTQTFMLAAVDERVGVLAPVNMISAHFQGGCVCENAPGLRTRTHNVEIAALAAPRPMLMVSATGDWTVNTPEVEYPAVREIYRLYDADDRLAWAQVDAPHNYNSESRMHVYRWFARWLLGDEAPAADPERGGDIGACSTESLRVFPSAALPEGAPVGPALERTLGDHARARLQSMPVDACANPSEWHEVIRRRWGHILDVEVPQPADVLSQEHPGGDLPEWSYRDVILGRRGQGDFVRGTLYRPVRRRSERPVLMVHGVGRGGFYDALARPDERLRAVLALGHDAFVIDPFYTGTVPEGIAYRPPQDWFDLTYNAPLVGHRVQDILTALAWLRGRPGADDPALVGMGGAGVWALWAAALDSATAALAVDLEGVAQREDDPWVGDEFAPALRAYGDVAAAVAALSPRPAWLAGAAGLDEEWRDAAYASCAPYTIYLTDDPLNTAALVAWLTGMAPSESERVKRTDTGD